MSTQEIPKAYYKLRHPVFIKLSLVVVFIGLLLAAYSIQHHLQLKQLGATDAFCNLSETFSCDKVAQSVFSEFLTIPLGVWGGGYFLSLFALLLLLRFSKKPTISYLYTYGVLVLLGCLISLALAYISIFLVQSFCLTCLGVYLVNIVQLCLFIYYCRSLVVVKWEYVRSVVQLSWVPLLCVGGVVLFFVLFFQQVDETAIAQNLKVNERSPLVERHEIAVAKTPYIGFGEDYRWGNDQAAIIITEFADFECPACAHAAKLLDELKQEFQEKLLIVFRNYPLDQHCNVYLTRPLHKKACDIAVLARCAGFYGKFGAYHDTAFVNQGNKQADRAIDWAKNIGLTRQQIDACLEDKTLLDKIKEDIKIGQSIGVQGTPAIFINGKRFRGERSLLRQEVLNLLSSN